MSEQLTAAGRRQRQRARRGQGDRLRTEIVDAASRMLAESGEVGELSLRAVAREVGIAATSIYLHFRGLDELVLAAKIRYFEDFGEQDVSMLATHIWTALHGIVTLRTVRGKFPWPDLDRQLDDLVDRLLAS